LHFFEFFLTWFLVSSAHVVFSLLKRPIFSLPLFQPRQVRGCFLGEIVFVFFILIGLSAKFVSAYSGSSSPKLDRAVGFQLIGFLSLLIQTVPQESMKCQSSVRDVFSSSLSFLSFMPRGDILAISAG